MVVSDWLQYVLILGLGFGLGWISRYGRRKGIQEARFDSKTGKEIK